jgi:hypothetical protein
VLGIATLTRPASTLAANRIIESRLKKIILSVNFHPIEAPG